MNQKTYITKASDIKRDWHLVDLAQQVLGREASRIAQLLIGKEKPYFTPNLDCGDYVIVINAGKIRVTGKKMKQKLYSHHSGYPGGFRQFTLEEMMKRDTKRVIELAVRNMLPKNKLRDQRMKRLKIFIDNKHPYDQQVQGNTSQ
ncbi:MAG: 50S ribosomal protein L13 [Candidatus Chisholmbacteria bacterium RIFCSPHIGHO2_12_FULL_49_9]|uniref:Large ribosomal subunit protein uL13 n=1 Tax=Candidatus Chisholmbacteria bacterium RIFCSPHIGHO2_01_FULL_52_32 TaxID=1797591 RepID=A0A1G1VTU5_9BACT|nr:MAG: 50S ribosomal protein L13 [Candidatus Chisholmbacteria bacterium RIFCSPHIGHO2_01_FULL_52_32]OGY19243.1 MAG: 50S ribosomal protein L13 [Candidatus Chisholmbacteria bacterium RIFCSPHIGHO2_12_FULL_49_9]OGY19804.1 MAG: 50S ribosomal protein L13 [Candidatus Chisholmbacteria bacterium RIFCSPLOWO2_01_FULL_50_28]